MTKRLLVLAAALLAALLPTASAFADIQITPLVGGHVQDDRVQLIGFPVNVGHLL